MRSTNGWTASWRRRSPSPGRRNSGAPTKWRATSARRPEEMRELKYWQAVNEALTEEMARDDTVTLAGEDVAAPGGPFGASRGLLEKFGPWRVKDTPISELTIAGLGVGAALAGLRPIVEIMFFDFVGLAMDQIVNQAAKFSYMSGGRQRVPMTIRTLCGAGRNNGPQHSQSLEAWIGHVPGLKLVW